MFVNFTGEMQAAASARCASANEAPMTCVTSRVAYQHIVTTRLVAFLCSYGYSHHTVSLRGIASSMLQIPYRSTIGL